MPKQESSTQKGSNAHLTSFLAKLPELEFTSYWGDQPPIQLTYDASDEENFGVKFGQRIKTPKGMATVVGKVAVNMRKRLLYLKVDTMPGVCNMGLYHKVADESGFSITPDFISKEELNKITFNSKLRLAIKKNDMTSIDALLNSPAISTEDIDRTIYLAIKKNNVAAVEKICKKLGVDVTRQLFAKTYNKYNSDGTHLHTAERMKNPLMLKTLMQYGANPLLKNATGKTALEIAKSRYFNKKCVDALSSRQITPEKITIPRTLSKEALDKNDIEEFDLIIKQHMNEKNRLTNEEYEKLITLVKKGNYFAVRLFGDIHANNLAPEAVCSKTTAKNLNILLKNNFADDYAAVQLDILNNNITTQTLKHAHAVVSLDSRFANRYAQGMIKWISHVAASKKIYSAIVREEAKRIEKLLSQKELIKTQRTKQLQEDKLQIRTTEKKPPTLIPKEEFLKLAHFIANGLNMSALNNLQLDELETLVHLVLTDAGIKQLPNNRRAILIHALITALGKQIDTIKNETTRIRLDVIISLLVEAQQYLTELTISSIQKSLAQLTLSQQVLFPDLPPTLPASKASTSAPLIPNQRLFDEQINEPNNSSQQSLEPTQIEQPKVTEVKSDDKKVTNDLYKLLTTMSVFDSPLLTKQPTQQVATPIERQALTS